MTVPHPLPEPDRWNFGRSPRPQVVRAVGTTTLGASVLAVASADSLGWALGITGAVIGFVSGVSQAVAADWKKSGFGKAEISRDGWLKIRYPYADKSEQVDLNRLAGVRTDFAGVGRFRYYVRDLVGNEAHLGACHELPTSLRVWLDERKASLPEWRRRRSRLT